MSDFANYPGDAKIASGSEWPQVLDLAQLNPEDFELMCEDLLRAMGFNIPSRPARGPDQGKDMIATRYTTDLLGNVEEERYLIECKHFAKSGKSVQESDIGNFLAKLSIHAANRYLLITSSLPSETVKSQLTEVSRDSRYPMKAGYWARNQLVAYLEQYPVVRSRYFPSTVADGGLHMLVANELQHWGLASHYVVDETRVRPETATCSLVLSLSTDGTKILACCVGGEANLSHLDAAEAEAISAGIGEVWLVALTRIAPSAGNRRHAHLTIRAFTVIDYINSIVRPYEAWLSQHIAALKLPEHYVELGFEKPTFSADGELLARDEYVSISAYIDSWSHEPSLTNLLLLGDFGSGKTWVTLKYASAQLNEFLRAPVGKRLPVYFPLRASEGRGSLLDACANYMSMSSGILGTRAALESLNRSGKLLFLLDGFDELGKSGSEDELREMVRRLREFALPRTRMVLTSRAHFFTSAWQAQELFASNLQPEVDGRRPAFEVMYLSTGLSGLTKEQIALIASKRLGKDYKRFIDFASSIYNLRDLMSRPLLLSLILETVYQTGQVPSDVYNIYDIYTGKRLSEWEAAKGISRSRLSSSERGNFGAALGWTMYRDDRTQLSREELRAFLRDVFPEWRREDFDELDSEVRTASFLVRDAAGNYSFAHKSFQEFFCAKHILKSFSDKDPTCLEFHREGANVFSDGIDQFIYAGISKDGIHFLKSVAKPKNALSLVARRLLKAIDLRRPPKSLGTS